jgi:hypothetical protein
MAVSNFTVAYSTTLESVLEMTPNIQVYADDLNNCQSCVDETGSCWACLSTQEQVFQDSALTAPVADGYYMVLYPSPNNPKAVWHIEGGYPQTEGFYN